MVVKIICFKTPLKCARIIILNGCSIRWSLYFHIVSEKLFEMFLSIQVVYIVRYLDRFIQSAMKWKFVLLIQEEEFVIHYQKSMVNK